ncbi:MAG: FKBP-type peptidyl-prolyl cis-trans isomerase [Ferruginibacter sp.]
MRKQFLILMTAAALLGGCKKKGNDCPYTEQNYAAPAAEITAMQAWCATNEPTAQQHGSGVFYVVTSPGTGGTASVCSNVTVKYTGYLLNGTIFDQNTSGFTSILGQLILGWQKGIPLVKAGGSIRLYIPPSLGYGNQDVRNNSGVVVIPANSYLKFTVDLVAVD